MKLTMERQVMHGISPTPRDSVYTEEQLAEINRRFDEMNGWSQKYPTVFFNAERLPETCRKPNPFDSETK